MGSRKRKWGQMRISCSGLDLSSLVSVASISHLTPIHQCELHRVNFHLTPFSMTPFSRRIVG